MAREEWEKSGPKLSLRGLVGLDGLFGLDEEVRNDWDGVRLGLEGGEQNAGEEGACSGLLLNGWWCACSGQLEGCRREGRDARTFPENKAIVDWYDGRKLVSHIKNECRALPRREPVGPGRQPLITTLVDAPGRPLRGHDGPIDAVVRRGAPVLEGNLDHLLPVGLGVPTRLRHEEGVVLEGLEAHPVLEGMVDRAGDGIPVGDESVRDGVGVDRMRAPEVETVAVVVGRGVG